MTEPELTAEEIALLESVAPEAAAPVVIEQPAEEAPRRRPRKLRDEAEIAPEPLVPVVVVSEPQQAMKGPHDHPLAPPAQHTYDDPWGLLPIQMRHDAEGKPVF